MTDGEAREMARDLVRGSIIEDAAAQFIAQILKHAHDERIKPLKARAEAAEAEVEKLRGALRDIEADCDADYPPSHDAIKQAIRAALSKAIPPHKRSPMEHERDD